VSNVREILLRLKKMCNQKMDFTDMTKGLKMLDEEMGKREEFERELLLRIGRIAIALEKSNDIRASRQGRLG